MKGVLTVFLIVCEYVQVAEKGGSAIEVLPLVDEDFFDGVQAGHDDAVHLAQPDVEDGTVLGSQLIEGLVGEFVAAEEVEAAEDRERPGARGRRPLGFQPAPHGPDRQKHCHGDQEEIRSRAQIDPFHSV